MTRLLARVDADPDMGTGHAHRVLALAQVWIRRAGQVTVATERMPDALAGRLREAGCTVVAAAPDFAAQAAGLRPDWVLLDGYHLGKDLQQRLLNAGLRVLLIDDAAATGAAAGVAVLDTNPTAAPERYGRGSAKDLMLGPNYVLLRSEYTPYAGWIRAVPAKAERLLVTLGGNAPPRIVETAIAAAGLQRGLLTRLVLGPAQVDSERLATSAAAAGLECVRDVRDMAQHMKWADIALIAAGTTTWEACFMQLPCVAVELATNQRANIEFLARQGLAATLGPANRLQSGDLASAIASLASDEGRRGTMAQSGRKLVDGGGSERVVQWLKSRLVRLRPVVSTDRDRVLEWANDPVVRSSSFAPGPIPAADHDRWFDARLSDASSGMWIGLDAEGSELGLVRIQGQATATISVNLAPDRRGQSWGVGLIEAGTRAWLAADSTRRHIHAFIKPDNSPSVRAFQSAGYLPDGTADQNGQVALRLVFARGSQP